ncbi:hypothetical protein AAG617_24190 [Enterobacter cloacae]|uniref:hypothetical protein n=1 Tax=Enterobacter cloacae TaxID=550 RepID=UPI00315A3F3B
MNATDIPQCCGAVSSFSNNLHAFAEGGTAVMANAMLDEEVSHLLVIRLATHHQAEHCQRPEVDRNPPPAFYFN